jgi:transglutaminase-like putative cysteine protease
LFSLGERKGVPIFQWIRDKYDYTLEYVSGPPPVGEVLTAANDRSRCD